MAIYEQLNERGLIVTDTATVRDVVSQEWRDALGQDLVVDDETPQGTLINGETAARTGVVRLNAAVANQINPRNAGGIFLDGICAFLGLKRSGAKPSINRSCPMTGAANTSVPAGAQVRDENGYVWRLTQGLTLDSDGNATGTFQCDTAGPIACPAGTMHTIITQVLGWETVTNTDAAELGRERQSDSSLRALREVTLGRQGISVNEAIISGLYDPAVGVRSLAYRENETGQEKEIDGITLKPHSIYVCCDGGLDGDIAMCLLREKTVGAGWNGSVSIQVRDDSSGQLYDVMFDRSIKAPIEVRLFVRQGTYTGEPTLTAPVAAVKYANGEVDGFRGFVLGTPWVSPSEIGIAVAKELPGILIAGTQARKAGETEWSYGELNFNINELPNLQISSVTVTVV